MLVCTYVEKPKELYIKSWDWKKKVLQIKKSDENSMFQLREINQMEREMYQCLEWELNMNVATLKEFEEMAHKD